MRFYGSRRRRWLKTCVAIALFAAVMVWPQTLSAATAAQRFGSANLQRGAKGAVVSELQRALARVGFSTGVISGFFGPVTERQVRAYQKARNLPRTGIVGPRTKAALVADLNHLEQATARAERAVVKSAPQEPPPPPLKGRVVLTFNDSPNPASTPAILQALTKAGVPATFFCTGERVAAEPDLVKQIVAAGCTVGVHGWSDNDYSGMTEAQIVADLRSCVAALTDAGASEPILFRPPHGGFDRTVLAAGTRVGLLPSYWSNVGGALDADSALKAAFDGAILLLPDNSATADSLPPLLTELRAAGWSVRAAGGR